VASGSESNHVFVYDLRWAKPIWVHPFVGGAHGPDTAGDAAAGGGFVSAVAWRQGSDHGGGGALVAGGSDGLLKMFTCHRRKAAGDADDASLLL
jgi:E3 ubiquitin-protein ligase RFWD2